MRKEELRTYIENHESEMIEDLKSLIRIPSEKQAAEPGKPFGAPAAEALAQGIEILEKYGFAVTNYDNYAIAADFNQEEKGLDILAHLDVVPAGEGWQETDPFTPLIKEGKIKKDKHESVIFRRDNSHYEKLDGIERCIDDEIPFEIPKNWKWTRFGQVISLLSGTDFKPEEYNDKQQGVPYITGASSLSEHGVLINRWTEVPRVIVNRGDVLLVCKGSGYGKTVICDIDEAHIARQIMAIKKMTTLDMPYIRVFLQANFEQIKSKGQGVIPGIDRNSVLNLLFPLPPLLEQRHIVEKQRELFNAITLI